MSRVIKKIYAQDATLVDPSDEVEDGLEEELDPLRAVCDCAEETPESLLDVGTFLEVKGIVVVALMTKPDRAKLIVSPSTTWAGPPTEIV